MNSVLAKKRRLPIFQLGLLQGLMLLTLIAVWLAAYRMRTETARMRADLKNYETYATILIVDQPNQLKVLSERSKWMHEIAWQVYIPPSQKIELCAQESRSPATALNDTKDKADTKDNADTNDKPDTNTDTKTNSVNGTNTTKSPTHRIPLSPGKHRIVFRAERASIGRNRSFDVRIYLTVDGEPHTLSEQQDDASASTLFYHIINTAPSDFTTAVADFQANATPSLSLFQPTHEYHPPWNIWLEKQPTQ